MTSEEKLIRSYQKARDELQKKMKTASGNNMRSYYRGLIKELDKTINALKKASADYARAAVREEYMQNAAAIVEQMAQQKQILRPPEAYRQLHSDAIYDLRREMQAQLEQGIEKARQQTAQMIKDAAELARKTARRSIGLDAAQYKVDTVGTVSDMQQEIKRRLEEGGILKVETGSGKHKREMSVTNYAHLVARSVSIEVGNTARINQLTANGYDLVEIPTHYPTCEICAILQDRVYSISGKDKRFPPLSRAIGEYKNIHPHCRHVIVGWVEEMHTDEEVEEAIKRSNREWKDPRSGEEKTFYNELQRKNRQARDLQAQYERYKERLGKEAPKSIAAFKRIKNAGGEGWEKLQAEYKSRGIDNSWENGIIKSDSDKSTTHTSIERRNTSKGNPNAILHFDVDLNNRQKKLLEQLPKYESRIIVPKNTVNMTDLAALTAKTGDEFAMFTKGNERLIIRGNTVRVNVDEKLATNLASDGYRWSGHTHPGTDFFCLEASDGDWLIVRCFSQNGMVIYNSKGQYKTFKKE